MLPSFRLLTHAAFKSLVSKRQSCVLPSLAVSKSAQRFWPEGRCSFATAQPSPEKLAAVPYSTTKQEAEAAYETFHTAFQLLARPHKDKIKESFLPFWIASCSVHVTLTRADIGFTQSEQQYNPRTKTWDSVQNTIWRTVNLHQEWERDHAASNPALQVYASYKYPR